MGAVILGDLEEPGTRDRRRAGRRAGRGLGPLEGTGSAADEVPLAIDELTLVALLGCLRRGRDRVRGAEELRLKESDRIAAVVEGLRGLGADIEATDDGFVVRGDGSACAAARSTRGAITAWRCSAPWPAWPPRRA